MAQNIDDDLMKRRLNKVVDFELLPEQTLKELPDPYGDAEGRRRIPFEIVIVATVAAAIGVMFFMIGEEAFLLADERENIAAAPPPPREPSIYEKPAIIFNEMVDKALEALETNRN